MRCLVAKGASHPGFGRFARSVTAILLALGAFILLSDYLGRAAFPSDAKSDPFEGPRTAAPATQALLSVERAPASPQGESGSAVLADPRVAAVMNEITRGGLLRYERELSGEAPAVINGHLYTITTRESYSGEPISQATRYAYERFQDAGLDVAFQEYEAGQPAQRWRNVIAERRGLRRPDEIYMLTAHLDDYPPGPVAPGADDNGSGSATVLLVAEALSRLDLDCTVRFALFTGEEQGLKGSAAYAGAAALAGDGIRGVLNLDMIGYNSDSVPILDLHARSSVTGSVRMAQTFSQVIAVYDLALVPELQIDHWLGNYSDNKSFWDEGYPAILAIEDQDDFNPYYHTVDDNVAHLDPDYLEQAAQAAAGTFAHMGCLASTGRLTGTVTELETGRPLSATISAVARDRIYTTTTGAGGIFSLTLPVFSYTLQARAHRGSYSSPVVKGVRVLTDTVTVQNFMLQRVPYRLFLPVLFQRQPN
jgi:hypothetical protein